MYLVVETPTTPCDAFFFPDRFRSMPLKTEIPPHGIVQKESFVESCDFSLVAKRTEKDVMRNLIKQKCSAKRPHTMENRARDV